MTSLVGLNRQRGALKVKVEKLCKFASLFTLDIEDVTETEILLKSKMKAVLELKSALEEMLLSYTRLPDEIDLKDALSLTMELQDELDQAEVKINIFLSKLNCNSSNEETVKNVNKFKIPDLPLPSFSGRYEDFQNFKVQFMSIIGNNPELKPTQQLCYLKGCLKGEAKRLESSQDTYDSLWSSLEDRYENKRAVIEHYVLKILTMSKIQDSPNQLMQLIDDTKCQIRALDLLGLKSNELSDTLILYILFQKLDPDVRKSFEMKLNKNVIPKLNDFLSFLEERSRIIQASTSQTQKKKFQVNMKLSSHPNSENHSLLLKNNNKTKQCVIFNCNETHPLYRCEKFKQMNLNKRIGLVIKYNFCRICLNNHLPNPCLSKSKCFICNKAHHSLIHCIEQEKNEDANTSSQVGDISSPPLPSFPSTSTSLLAHENQKNPCVILNTAVIYLKNSSGSFSSFVASLDCCSSVNLITTNAANPLGLKKQKTHVPIAGISDSICNSKSFISTELSNETKSKLYHLDMLVVPKIAVFPSCHINISNYNFPSNVKLADKAWNIPKKVDVILGASLFFDLLGKNKIKIDNSQLYLVETVFGHIVSGTVPPSKSDKPSCNSCLLLLESERLDKALTSFWEIEQVDQTKPIVSEELRYCNEHFLNTHYRKNDGHMEEIVEDKNPEEGFFFPHHGVLRPSSTSSKLRVAFDGSCKTTNGKSLNDLLLKGGMMQDDLFAITTRFRKHIWAFTVDINKMFRQIEVDPSHTNFQKILWREGKEEPDKIFRLKTVTYGCASSPYLATRTLQQLARDEEKSFPLASEIVLNDFYMDDCLSGSSNLTNFKELTRQLSELLQAGQMCLHKWRSNADVRSLDCPDFSFKEKDLDSPVKTLGLLWNSNSDTFNFKVTVNLSSTYTKREVLSQIARLFDPLGLIGPVICQAKILMQQLWLLKCDWNEQVPPDFLLEWDKFLRSLPVIETFNIPRCILVQDPTSISIHGFADASERAFGASVYLKSSNSDTHSCKLICSKSRVSPLKTVSIPRLELSACLLLCQLVHRVMTALKLKTDKVTLWSDSTIALAWISTSPHLLKTFVSNRVSLIQELSKNFDWKHVISECNPSDPLSRGQDAISLSTNKLWWDGPEFLADDNWTFYSNPESNYSEEHFAKELKQNTTSLLTVHDNLFFEDLFSITNSFLKLIRVVSLLFRFHNNCRKPEAGVKSFKYYFKRTVGDTILTYEEFLTIVIQVEGILNSRPLTPLTSNIDDLDVLTPGHFLIGRPINTIAEPNLTGLNNNRLSLWQKTTKMVQNIWKNWSNNYLSTLIQRNKWLFAKQNVKIGDMVVVKEENLPTCKWLLGRINEIFYGKDNHVRVVTVQTKNGIYKRPITKIAVLPIENV
ncbi:uncharacterized protein LOC129218291 [Uloborus diversus]|uniref:uncharacterized protein LOC129218291 n=1 Tax=Uloborus diversus TaxID=327109 RepID=UPI00240A0709|nr:uncharacterized protein LOC129218291 [Uloborus diversus]